MWLRSCPAACVRGGVLAREFVHGQTERDIVCLSPFFFFFLFLFLPPPLPPPFLFLFFPPTSPPFSLFIYFLTAPTPPALSTEPARFRYSALAPFGADVPPAPGQPHAAAAPRCPARRSRSRARSRGPSSGRALGMSAGNERSVKAPLIRVMNPKEPAAAELTPPREEGGNNRGSN